MSETARLLRVVVTGTPQEIARALHPRVCLTRADGTVVQGRSAVVAALGESVDGQHHEVVATQGEALVVALTMTGLTGEMRFTLRGEQQGDRLVGLFVEV